MKLAVAAALLCAVPMFAADPLVGTISKHLKLSKEYTIDIAKQMPADGYSFKPNAEEMSFGQQMNHIADAVALFSSMMDGSKPKEHKVATKDETIENLTSAFDNALAQVGKLHDSQLHEMKKSPEGDGDMALLDGLLLMLDHTTHHRGQCVVYLRVKGIKPADYRF